MRELRAINQEAWQAGRGGSPDAAMRGAGIWPRRQPLARKALARHGTDSLDALLEQAGRVERIVKGAAWGSPWTALTELLVSYAGRGRSGRPGAAA